MNISRGLLRAGSGVLSMIQKSMSEARSGVTSVSPRPLIEKSSWLIVEEVSNDLCLWPTERASLHHLCESEEPLSFSVLRGHILVWRTSTRTLVIGLDETRLHMIKSCGVSTRTKIFLGCSVQRELLLHSTMTPLSHSSPPTVGFPHFS